MTHTRDEGRREFFFSVNFSLARSCLALLARFALSFARLKKAIVMEDAEQGVDKPNTVRV